MLIECVPNVSEGRRPDVIAAMVEALGRVPGVRLLDHSSDPSHNRSVFTLVGERTVEFLSDYSVDWTFLGADAIDPVAGITNTNTLEIPVKRAMIAAAARTAVLADSSKFGQRALARVATLAEVDAIVTDAGLDADAAAHYGDHLRRVNLAP